MIVAPGSARSQAFDNQSMRGVGDRQFAEQLRQIIRVRSQDDGVGRRARVGIGGRDHA